MTSPSNTPKILSDSNNPIMASMNNFAERLDDAAPDSPVSAIRERFVNYLSAVAEAVYSMRLDEFLEVNGKDRYWDIPGEIVERFVRHVEYTDESTGVRPGWFTEDKEPRLWAVYDAAHDLDIDERCLDDWVRLFGAIEALRAANLEQAVSAS